MHTTLRAAVIAIVAGLAAATTAPRVENLAPVHGVAGVAGGGGGGMRRDDFNRLMPIDVGRLAAPGGAAKREKADLRDPSVDVVALDDGVHRLSFGRGGHMGVSGITILARPSEAHTMPPSDSRMTSDAERTPFSLRVARRTGRGRKAQSITTRSGEASGTNTS